MNISQALKTKNRIAGDIQKLIEKAIHNNVAEDGNKPYSSKASIKEVQEKISELVKLKTSIHKASAPVREKIFRLSELKGLMSRMEHFPTGESIIRNRTTGEVIGRHVAEISAKEHDEFLQTTQKEIDKLQEELDAFNHTTSI